jgi:hypothetical protein
VRRRGLLVAGGVALFDCEWCASLEDVDADGFSSTNGSVFKVVREEGRRSGAAVLYSNVSFPLQRSTLDVRAYRCSPKADVAQNIRASIAFGDMCGVAVELVVRLKACAEH